MRKYPLTVVILFICCCAGAQNVAVNTTGNAAAATNLFEVTQNSATNNTVGIFSTHSGAATNAYAIWAEVTGASTNKYAIVVPPSSGSMGLGTITPVSLLHMNGVAPTLTFMHSTGTNQDNTGVISFLEDATAGFKMRYDGANNRFHIASRETSTDIDRLTIARTTGNVGIGITAGTNPASLFHVNGNAQIGTVSSTTGQLTFYNSSSANATTFQAGNATAAVIYTLPTADGTNGQVLTTNGSGTLSWGTAVSGGGATGASIIYPDGTNFTTAKFTDYGTSGYTVPANTTLYIMHAPLGLNVQLLVDGIVILSGNAYSPGLNRPTLSVPIVVGPGSVVTGNTATAQYFIGFEVTSTTYTAVTRNIHSIDATGKYQVPAGKTLVITNYYDNTGYLLQISPNDVTYVDVLAGPSNFRTGTSSPPVSGDFKLLQLLQPILVPSGYYVKTSNGTTASKTAFNGYLR